MNLNNLPEVWAGGSDINDSSQLELAYLSQQAEVVTGEGLFPSDVVLISMFHVDPTVPVTQTSNRRRAGGISGRYVKSWGLVISRSLSEARPHVIQFVVLIPVTGFVVLFLTSDSSGIWRLKK
jgi:hypothetical protein